MAFAQLRDSASLNDQNLAVRPRLEHIHLDKIKNLPVAAKVDWLTDKGRGIVIHNGSLTNSANPRVIPTRSRLIKPAFKAVH